MKCIPLKEGVFWASKSKEFSLAVPDSDLPVEIGALKMAICPFLIELPNDLVLIDAGLGFYDNGKPLLLSVLQKAGYQPEQVTKIILSHLHKDHIGGLFFFDGKEYKTAFPEATLFLQQREMTYALSQLENPSFDQGILQALQKLPRVVYLNNDNGTIGNYIAYQVTGGHSPFHQVFWIRDGNEVAFYGGDNLPQQGYLKFHIAYKSDYEGKKAMELRQIWEQAAKDEGWQLLLYHDLEKNVLLL